MNVIGSKISNNGKSLLSYWDFITILLFSLIFGTLINVAHDLQTPIAEIVPSHISLTPLKLVGYTLNTTLRMFIAIIISVIFSIIYATIAAKCERLGKIMIIILDILQSVPILGYLTFTVAFFIALFPGRSIGIECAAIFAIFTSQAWNITFSFYNSLTNIPSELKEVAKVFHLNAWQKFLRIELPFAIPGILWNVMVSISGGWFFIVAAESISVGASHYSLPGVGSYIATAVLHKDLHSIFYAIIAMITAIYIYDQIIFRPLVAWADKFKFDSVASSKKPESWLYKILTKARVVDYFNNIMSYVFTFIYNLKMPEFSRNKRVSFNYVSKVNLMMEKVFNFFWYGFLVILISSIVYLIDNYMSLIDKNKVILLFKLTGYTFIRVTILVFVASLVWLPIGIYIGLRPHLVSKWQGVIQFLAAFPVNLIFPVFVYFISTYKLNPEIWLSPLLIIGTQWYILFNVMAGASTFPQDLKEVSSNFEIKGWLWFRKVAFPAVLPYFITGALTATGGAWNACIVAEIVNWGNQTISAHGIGSYIAKASAAGKLGDVALGVAIMSLVIVVLNRFFWTPLSGYISQRNS